MASIAKVWIIATLAMFSAVGAVEIFQLPLTSTAVKAMSLGLLLYVILTFSLAIVTFVRGPVLPLDDSSTMQKITMCRTCGYDLRASPDRCPECGTPIAK